MWYLDCPKLGKQFNLSATGGRKGLSAAGAKHFVQLSADASSLLYLPARERAAGRASLVQATFQTPPATGKGSEKEEEGRGIKGWRKAGSLAQSCWEKGEQARGGQPAAPSQAWGAQPTTVPFSLPAGAKPRETRPGRLDPSLQRGTAPGHCHAGKARVGDRGPAWLCTLWLSSAHLPSLSHPPLLSKREEGAGSRHRAQWERRQGRRVGGKAGAWLAGER